jgi:hypothetical protein
MSTFGRAFRVTTFGESHGGGVGCIIGTRPHPPPKVIGLGSGLERDRALPLAPIQRRTCGRSSSSKQRPASLCWHTDLCVRVPSSVEQRAHASSSLRGVCVRVDGVPPCLPLTEEDIQPQLSRRRPGQSALTTPVRPYALASLLLRQFSPRACNVALCACACACPCPCACACA